MEVVKNSNIVAGNNISNLTKYKKNGKISPKFKGDFFMSYNDYFREAKEGASLEEKIEIIKNNNLQASNMRREIGAWGGGSLQVSKNQTNISIESNPVDKPSDEIDNNAKELYDEISLLELQGLSEEEILNRIRKILGKDANYTTISKIKLLLYKECIIYNRMILAATDPSEIADLREMLASIKLKIESLDELEELEDEQEVEEYITTNNNIFFLLSETGKIIALESLRKNIPRDYYPAFKELLLGLKAGKAKGLKRLKRHGYLELKDFKIRVTFDKLSNGNYIILDCFMKKVDTGISYRNNLANRTSQYQRKQKQFLADHTNEEFIKEHEGYFIEILSLLESKDLEGEEKNVARSI